jgi:hypothetical protein
MKKNHISQEKEYSNSWQSRRRRRIQDIARSSDNKF